MKAKEIIRHGVETIRKRKGFAMSLSVIVVFVTTYILIMPAMTLDEQSAQKQGGIDLHAASEQAKAGQSADENADADAAGRDAADPKESAASDEAAGPEDNDDGAEAGDQNVEEAAQNPSDTGKLTAEGNGYSVSAIYDAKADIPDDTELTAEEIGEKDKDYQTMRDLALAALQKKDGKSKAADLKYSRFFDITLTSDGGEVEPAAPVDVTISYDKALAAEKKERVRVLHFTKNEKTGKLQAEILDPKKVEPKIAKQKMTGTAFEAESFSVYGIVYTVDFSYEVDGKTYKFSMDGEDSVSLKKLAKKLHLAKDIDAFMKDVKTVEFSDPKLLAVAKAEEDTTLGRLKAENKISQKFAALKDQGEVMKRNSKKFAKGDWALISLKPFSTKEELKVTLTTGEQFVITVTDAQDAVMNGDGTVKTIPNPSGTTIDLFNYWVSDDLKDNTGRSAWPGYYDGWYYHDENDYEWYKNATLLGEGNDAGINQGHMLKFSPAWAGTVYDGTIANKETGEAGKSPTRNPTNVNYANDGDRLYYTGGVNSYTGNGDPRQGLVEDTLSGGYPKLTDDSSAGTNGESLEYLFKPESASYKDYYSGVDHLMYVDKDGYYTYDSRDYKAELQGSDFVLTEQTSDDTEVRGFWPFGQQKFWSGMHMNTQFSMPKDGQVLNPKGQYKDMQFEFSGDDDTWVYVDGVLVGDGGGIHNRTEIDVNFAAGTVTVTGKKDANHTGQFEETKWLDDIFRDAGRFNEDDWEPIPGSSHMRFKAGTYHTFDMFYLERGGGESNLYIHYNLVSTEDFTGHKAYEGFADDERMARDQFHFEMIGLDGRYSNGSLVDAEKQAIMPLGATAGGAGTFEDPKMEYSDSAWTDSGGTTYGGNVFTTGVTENGDIRFGAANIDAEEMNYCDQGTPSEYHYIIREIVPDDAVNDDGVTWADADETQRAAGGFVKDQVRYDGRVYYMSARVTSWDQTGADGNTYKQYGLSKRYYTDDTFTTVNEDATFVDFRNEYAPDIGGVEFTKTDGSNAPLPGAEFTLYSDRACTNVAKDLDGEAQVKTSGADGKVSFGNLAAPRTYYMKETGVPSGYAENATVYKVVIEDSKDPAKQSTITILDDASETPVTRIVDPRPGELSVIKAWEDPDGNPVSGGDKTARVKLLRKHYTQDSATSTPHDVTFTIRIRDRSDLVYTYTEENVTGGTVTVDWWDTNQAIDSQSVTDAAGNEMAAELSNYWDDVNHKNRKLTIPDVSSDISVEIVYPSDKDWLFNSEHTPWMKDVAIAGSGPSYELVEDTDFNSSAEGSHFAELAAPNWSKIWTIGPGQDFPSTDGTKPYVYYIAEVDEAGNVLQVGEETDQGWALAGYSPENAAGITGQGSVTVTNRFTSFDSSLKLRKFVTISGLSPHNDAITDKTLADGTYTFTIQGTEGTDTADVARSVEITVTNGEAVSAKYTDGDDLVLDDDGFVTLEGLPPGEYTITEAEDHKTICTEVLCSGSRFIGDPQARTITVTVAPGYVTSDIHEVTYTNNFTPDDEQDIAHVNVRKTFTGITPDQIPSDFRITVTARGNTYYLTNNPIAANPPDGNGVTFDGSQGGGLVWNWTISIPGLKPGDPVNVEETGRDVPGYTVTTTVNGADGTAQSGQIDPSVVVRTITPTVIPQNNRLDFTVYDTEERSQIFLARLVPSQDILVISRNKLNLSERTKVETMLQDMPIGNWTGGNVLYYSFADAAGDEINVRSRTVTYNEETQQIHFSEKCQWNMVATAEIVYQLGRPADFNFVNDYAKADIAVELVKVDEEDLDATDPEKLPGAAFTIEKYTDARYLELDEDWGDEGKKSLADTAGTGTFSFSGLTTGFYKIVETARPAGYVQAEEDPIFEVRAGDSGLQVILLRQKQDGSLEDVTDNRSDTVKVTNTTIRVGNTPGAELPSSGGPGTTWLYLLGTVLLLVGGILLIARRRTA